MAVHEFGQRAFVGAGLAALFAHGGLERLVEMYADVIRIEFVGRQRGGQLVGFVRC